MNRNLLGTISSMMPQFSKGQKLIARYIIEHYDKAAFMTAAKLGMAVGVSESTIVRFATELGFSGYPQLQRALQELIRNRLTSVQRMELTGEQIGKGDLIERVLNMDIDKIRRTIEETSREEFQAVVDALDRAGTIYIMGIRSSTSLANFMEFYFNHVFPDVRLITSASTSDVFEQMFRAKQGDVFIGISFPRYSKRTVAAMRFAKEKGATTVALTDSSLSPISELADLHLYARSDMTSFVDSLVAPLSLINALITAVGISRQKEIAKTFEELEQIWDRYDIYAKTDDND